MEALLKRVMELEKNLSENKGKKKRRVWFLMWSERGCSCLGGFGLLQEMQAIKPGLFYKINP